MTTALDALIINPLTELAAAYECEAAYPTGCKPIVPGMTHCKSCGFHISTPRRTVMHKDACATPEWHRETVTDSHGITHTLSAGYCIECGETEDWIYLP